MICKRLMMQMILHASGPSSTVLACQRCCSIPTPSTAKGPPTPDMFSHLNKHDNAVHAARKYNTKEMVQAGSVSLHLSMKSSSLLVESDRVSGGPAESGLTKLGNGDTTSVVAIDNLS